MNEKTAAVYRSLCIVRVVDAHDPVDQLFIGNSFLNRQVVLLKQDYFCFQNLLPADPSEGEERSSVSSSSSTGTPPGSPKGSRKGSDKKSSSSKSKDNDSEGESTPRKKDKDKGKHADAKKPPPDLKLHSIDYYLKRLKPKIKGPVQNVDPKDAKELQ